MKFIFVGGCGRSGTTMVQKLLTRHSKISGGPEFTFTKAIAELYKEMSHSFFLDYEKSYYDIHELRKKFQEFYSSYFKRVAQDKPEAIFISEKTPTNIRVAEILLELFPDSLFINVVRDGRDVLLSHQEVAARYRAKGEKYQEKAFTTPRISMLWNTCVDLYFKLKEKPELSARTHSLKFEELVRNPDSQLEDLFRFIGLEMEYQILHPKDKAMDLKSVNIDDVWYTRGLYDQDFNVSKIGRWKEQLSWQDKFISNRLMKNNLFRLGYS